MNAHKIQVKQADTLLVSLEDTFKSLPKLPKGFTDFLVVIAPWLAIICGVILLLGLVLGGLFVFLATFFAMLTGSPLYAVSMLVGVAATLIEGVLLVMAFSPLQKREIAGWRMLAYSTLVGAVSSIVSFIASFSVFGLVWFVFVFALCFGVGFYLLFQMKHSYH